VLSLRNNDKYPETQSRYEEKPHEIIQYIVLQNGLNVEMCGTGKRTGDADACEPSSIPFFFEALLMIANLVRNDFGSVINKFARQ
jgi:hypothetical protein